MLSIKSMAQQTKLILKDSPILKVGIDNNAPIRQTAALLPVEVTIENELNKIVAAYTNQPNTAATWIQIKAAANVVLYRYFRDGKLLGTKKEQAYYIMMGPATMTATDITNGKMILIAGIAPNKPGEFMIIKVTKKSVIEM